MGKLLTMLGNKAVIVALLAIPFGVFNFELATQVLYWMVFMSAVCLLTAAVLSRFSKSSGVGVGIAAKVLNDIGIGMPEKHDKKYADLVQRLAVAFCDRVSISDDLKHLTYRLAVAEEIFIGLLAGDKSVSHVSVGIIIDGKDTTGVVTVSRSPYGFLVYTNQHLKKDEPLALNTFAIETFIKVGKCRLDDSKKS